MKPKRYFTVKFHKMSDYAVLIHKSLVYKLEEVEQKIWDACDGSQTIEEIAATIAADYPEVDANEVLEDTRAFIQDLETQGLVKSAD